MNLLVDISKFIILCIAQKLLNLLSKGIKKALKTNRFSEPFLILPHGFGTPSGIRTLDPLIKSQLLYQLS